MKNKMTNINQTALGLALGIVYGAGLALLAVVAKFTGYGIEWVDLMGTVYYGAGAGRWLAVLLTFAWGFVDGFVCGWLIGWIYNKLS